MSKTVALDLHVHSTSGSADAALKVIRLGEASRAAGLSGVVMTEHLRQWSASECQAAAQEQGIVVLPAREWTTPLGHILAFGVSEYSPAMRDPHRLREAADAEGGLLIAAHPFRHFFDPPRQGAHVATLRTEDPEEAAQLPIFAFVDAIEVMNGNCTKKENDFAAAVAEVLRVPATAGSDAHYAQDLGRCFTVVPGEVRTIHELMEVLRSRAHRLSGAASMVAAS